MRISDWSSDVCSSDLERVGAVDIHRAGAADAFAAGAPEGQRRIDLVLDLDEGVEDHRAAAVEIHLEAVDARVGAVVRIPAVDPEGLGVLRIGWLRPGLAGTDLGIGGKGELGHRTLSLELCSSADAQ